MHRLQLLKYTNRSYLQFTDTYLTRLEIPFHTSEILETVKYSARKLRLGKKRLRRSVCRATCVCVCE